jgi:two-component system, NtrC family, nitrogen regulation sensor histidine kinase NtrY
MVSKNYRLKTIIHVVVLIGTIFLFVYLLLNTQLIATTIILVFIMIITIWSLFGHLEKSNRDLILFLDSIKHNDFTTTFPVQNSGRSFDDLRAAFNEVLAKFRDIRMEKEEDLHYMQTVVGHIPIGLIGFEPDGHLVLTNPAAKKLLGIAQIKNINDLPDENKKLAETLMEIKAGQKNLVVANHFDEQIQLSLSATELKRRGQIIKLVTLQNITGELAEREMQAWQQLVRVLTHEIMNSVTPIASLTSTISNMLGEIGAEEKDENNIFKIESDRLSDMQSAASAVEKRGEGLVNFINAYQNLSKIPTPDFKIVLVNDLLERIKKLILSRSDSRDIHVIIDVVPDALELTADPDLIEQVLLNLVINSLQAMREQVNGIIKLNGRLKKGGRVIIQVIDNGPGIQSEAMDKLFVPFFTTKRDGTGIGLSLSRQIMRMHHGDITVSSKLNDQTVFTLHF